MDKTPRTQVWKWNAMMALVRSDIVTLFEKDSHTEADMLEIRDGWMGQMHSMAGNWFDVTLNGHGFTVVDRKVGQDIRI